jgi:3-isopropylmalate/(R)-2-methylmalate dehydratase small subunit
LTPGATQIRRVSGTAIPVRGNDIDTDRIVPARYLKEITFDRMGEYPFLDERFDPEGRPRPHPFNDPRYRGPSILLVNQNFGCGSSREHAPQALYRFGIRAIVGESFAAIFAGNCLAIGLPAVTVPSEEMGPLMDLVESRPDVLLTVDLPSGSLLAEGREIPLAIANETRKALVQGYWDSASMLLANSQKTRDTAARLPYLHFEP